MYFGWMASTERARRKKKCIANVIEHIKRYICNPFFAQKLFLVLFVFISMCAPSELKQLNQ